MPMAGRHPIEEGGSERPSRTILMPTTWGNSGPMESPNDASRTHEVHADVLEKRLTSEDFGHGLTLFDSMGPGPVPTARGVPVPPAHASGSNRRSDAELHSRRKGGR